MSELTMKYRDLLNLNTHLLWCYKQQVIIPSKGQFVPDRFVNNGAWRIYEGCAQVRHDGKTFKAMPGQWLIVKPGKRLRSFAPDTVILSVAFDAHWPDRTKWLEDGLSLVFDAEDYPMLEKRAMPMVKIMKKLGIAPGHWDIRESRIQVMDFLSLEKSLNTWFTELLKVLSDHDIYPSGNFGIDDRVARAIQIMNNSVVGVNLDMHGLAEQVGISLVHLTRLFHQDINQSPKKYYENLRLEYAINGLNYKGIRTNEIAQALGFAYVSNFSNWFKKHTGMSPRNFLKH